MILQSPYGLFFLSFLICLFSVPCIAIFSRHINLIAYPDSRRTHKGTVPLAGGSAILLSQIVLTMLGLSIPLWVFYSSIFLFIVGLCDDLFEFSAKTKFIFQSLACATLVIGGDVQVISLGTLENGVELKLGQYASIFTVFAILGMVNAINMIDGIDGLAGGLSLIIFFHLALAGYLIGRPIEKSDLDFMIGISGAVGAFLLFNLASNDKKVFLGDSGSTLLGLWISYFVIKTSQYQPMSSTLPTSLVCWILAIPIFETVSLIIYRLSQGRSPFSPDRQHLHHLLARISGSTLFALNTILAAAIIVFWLGFAISAAGGLQSGIIFCFTLIKFHLVVRAKIGHCLRVRVKKFILQLAGN